MHTEITGRDRRRSAAETGIAKIGEELCLLERQIELPKGLAAHARQHLRHRLPYASEP